MTVSLTTFNVNNLFVRYKFGNRFPGDRSKLSKQELDDAAEVLGWFLPGRAPFGKLTKNMNLSSEERRACIVKLLCEPTGQLPDIVAFQEVESIDALRLLDQRLGLGYPNALVIDGNDVRNIDVGILTRLPIGTIRTHVNDLNEDGDGYLFSRDCLEVDVELPDGETLTLFINHFKSKYVESGTNDTVADVQRRRRAGHARRQAQAQHVLDIVKERFAGRITTALFAVIGDFNDTAESPYLAPLFDYPYLSDPIADHIPNIEDRWTHWWKGRNRVSQIDHILVSRALRDRINANVAAGRVPHIARQGIGYKSIGADGDPLPKVTTVIAYPEDDVTPRPDDAADDLRIPFSVDRYPEVAAGPLADISDHCPVRIWF